MADLDQVENWRLSRIEDELEKLDFTQDFSFSDSIFNSLPSEIGQSLKLTAAAKSGSDQKLDEGYSEDEIDLPPPPQELLYPDDSGGLDNDLGTAHSELSDPGPVLSQLTRVCVSREELSENGKIYSEANVKTPIIKNGTDEDAVRRISDKYDSLKRLTLPSLPKFIPPGYVKAKPTSVKHIVSSPVIQTTQMPHVPPPSPVKMSDPFLDCLPTKHSTAQPPPQSHSEPVSQPISSNTSWSDMDAVGCRMVLADQQMSPNVHSIRRTPTVSSLNENEILQVEMFYRSHKSEVFVCNCMADLYYGNSDDKNSAEVASKNFYSEVASSWTSVMSGVPVIILEMEDRHGNKKLSVVIAERGTGFCMWKETFTHLTEYTAKHPNFHTLHLDADHTKLAGIDFQEAAGASEFLQRLRVILENPEIPLVNINARSKKNKNSSKTKNNKLKRRPTSKGDISAPCCFTHITSLDRSDGMGALETKGNNDGENNSATASNSVVHSRQKVK